MRFLFLALILLALPAGAAPVESRCAALGTQCLCSEPLRYTSGGPLVVNDPPDSEGAGAKECKYSADARTLDLGGGGVTLVNEVDNSTGVDFPGPNPPAYVLKFSSSNVSDTTWALEGTLPTGVRNETVCSRSYQRFSSDLPMIDEDNGVDRRAKLQEVMIPGIAHQIQQQIFHDGSGRIDTYDEVGSDCTGTVNLQLAGRTSWLRHEVCIDVGTSSVSSRQRMTVIDTGVTDTVPCGPYPVSTPISFSGFLIGNLYLQTMGNSAYDGSRYFTHAIQTRVPLDTSFWPGAATELEGGGGTPPPPPPAPLGKPGQPTFVP